MEKLVKIGVLGLVCVLAVFSANGVANATLENTFQAHYDTPGGAPNYGKSPEFRTVDAPFFYYNGNSQVVSDGALVFDGSQGDQYANAWDTVNMPQGKIDFWYSPYWGGTGAGEGGSGASPGTGEIWVYIGGAGDTGGYWDPNGDGVAIFMYSDYPNDGMIVNYNAVAPGWGGLTQLYLPTICNNWTAGSWHHVVVTWDTAADLELTLDGTSVASAPITTPISPLTRWGGMYISRSIGGVGAWGIYGAIDELSISDGPGKVLFVAHYDGNTQNSGKQADHWSDPPSYNAFWAGGNGTVVAGAGHTDNGRLAELWQMIAPVGDGYVNVHSVAPAGVIDFWYSPNWNGKGVGGNGVHSPGEILVNMGKPGPWGGFWDPNLDGISISIQNITPTFDVIDFWYGPPGLPGNEWGNNTELWLSGVVNNWTAGSWHHIVATWTVGAVGVPGDGKIELFVDEVSVGSATPLLGELSILSYSGMFLGGSYGSVILHTDAGWYIDGSLDELALYANYSAPVAVCQDIQVALNGNGQATITASAVDGGSYDPDGDPVTLDIDIDSFDCDDVGTPVTVTLTVSDGELIDTCEAEVTVSPVVVTCALVPAGNGGFYYVDFSATDSCTSVTSLVADIDGVPVTDGQLVKLTHSDTNSVKTNRMQGFGGLHINTNGPGTLTVTATDGAGNVGECTVTSAPTP